MQRVGTSVPAHLEQASIPGLPSPLRNGAAILPSIPDGAVLQPSFAAYAQHGAGRQEAQNHEQEKKKTRMGRDALNHEKGHSEGLSTY